MDTRKAALEIETLMDTYKVSASTLEQTVLYRYYKTGEILSEVRKTLIPHGSNTPIGFNDWMSANLNVSRAIGQLCLRIYNGWDVLKDREDLLTLSVKGAVRIIQQEKGGLRKSGEKLKILGFISRLEKYRSDDNIPEEFTEQLTSLIQTAEVFVDQKW